MSTITTTTGILTMLRNLMSANQLRATSMKQLSTGLRINTAADDPAGLIASEQLRSELAALDSELEGSARAIQRKATADSALSETQLLLVEIRGAFALAANSGGMSDEEIEAQQLLVDEAVKSIDRIAGGTTFNGEALLDGTDGLSVYAADLGDAATGYLNSLASGGDNDMVSGNYEQAASIVTAALGQISQERGRLGAEQVADLETRIRSLQQTQINLSASESAIRDTDYAAAMANELRGQILQKATLGALALSATSSRGVLDLLG
ncbi:MAG: hypothetical protein JXL80_07480 [Planctomycetes bacterium]|nr:hypothetical protein [Planctomycetota bacterium]